MKIYRNIKQLYTFKGFAQKKGRHPQEKDFGIVKNAVLVTEKNKVLWVGAEKKLPKEYSKFPSARFIDLKNQNVFPAFTESHTHLVFSGNRKQEFEQKIQGKSYLEIQKSGGGISSTVKATKKSSLEDLKKQAQERLRDFKKQGVSLIEVKSGYGQDLKTEMKQLEVAFLLKGLKVIPSYLALHSYKGDKDDYVNRVLQKDLPSVLNKFSNLKRADLFVEKSFFTKRDLKRFVKEIKGRGLSFCVHSDQLSAQGVSLLSAQLGALSVEHAVHMRPKEIKAFAQTQTVANLLPAADFYLQADYPKARGLIDAGARVSLATDFNPGSAPSMSLAFVGLLARRMMKMTLAEVFCAYTYNASQALGVLNKGALVPGYLADFFVSPAEHHDFFYDVTQHPVEKNYF